MRIYFFRAPIQRLATLIPALAVVFAAATLSGCGGTAGTPGKCQLGSTVGCGGTLPPPTDPPATDPATLAHSVSLVFSSNELPSAGIAGTEVAVTALVRTVDNVALPNAKIVFMADSGVIVANAATTDSAGKAGASLGTGGSRMNRAIVVTATVGSKSATAVVNVVGTKVVVSGPADMTLGASAELLAALFDSAGRPIAGQEVGATAKIGNTVFIAAKQSDSLGQVTVRVTATVRGSEQVTVSALGASVVKAISVGGSDVGVTPAVVVGADGSEQVSEFPVGSCAPIGGNATIGGTVTLAASRGRLYTDAGCTTLLAGARALVGGAFPATWIRSDNAGMSTIVASVSGGGSGGTRVEFVAPLGALGWVDLQAEAAVVGSGERTTMIAVVRDGTAANNLVKGALVQFSILADPSGGNLLSPFTVETGSDGVARAVFVAGPADGGKNGTVIEARLGALPEAVTTTALTVNKKALSIQFGTGNQLLAFSDSVLQQDFTVFVSDSAGNPVKDVQISVAGWPVNYAKGVHEWKVPIPASSIPGHWALKASCVCANEDVLRKGLFENAYDVNGNGVLDPGIPFSVSSSGKTDALGLVTVSVRYPRDRAGWVKLALEVTGTVAGTESHASNSFWLRGLAKDYDTFAVAPPGMTSPYGTGQCEVAF
ncbi:Ig-like domain-containing protein [Massilia glaciei]|uniref:Ig domain-containing protein n=1 Tax=Massilia glaciei TaxID=1524097 RepID=A0A2U2I7M8_9BURK|nr:Ig-like domain-containing protein [Massilia glaciei]PWF55737.1 Ig domain-containing protein [Massilia glaciei]